MQTVIAADGHRIAYSSAGHPPPLLADPDGTVRFLDRSTDPPLGAAPRPTPRPQATATCADGATLVLYTDGLIERRGEDIDEGLRRLAARLAEHHQHRTEDLADALIELSAGTDDTALVVLRL